MIDPTKITNYNQSVSELEEVLVFWVCVAGKQAKIISKALDNLLNEIQQKKESPFEALKRNERRLPYLLKKNGVGCYNQKARTLRELVNSKIDLKSCGHEDLEKIFGIGMKTSRCFLIHSRYDAKVAGLDVHILKFLRDNGIDSPKGTPTRKKYLELEQVFLNLVPDGKSVAEFDLEIWNKYSLK